MPLTLRPTGLSGNPHRNDWSIHEDGVEIGRLYEDRQTRSLSHYIMGLWRSPYIIE
jgi:hypothetical protein